MSLDTDALVDRRRLRRSLALWRSLCIIALFAGIAALTVYWTDTDLGLQRQFPHIARLPISGAITSDRKLIERIEAIGKNDGVKGVIIAINSPGGTTVGGEILYHALRELAEKKPTVAQIGTIGTSAGYLVAVAADHVVAHHTTITGSVGVLIQYPKVVDLLDTIGVTFRKIESGELKAEPSPFEVDAPGAEAMLQEVVNNSFVWFKDIVVDRRGLSPDQVATISSGRIFTGAQALQINLVDSLGGEEAAVAWLETARDVEEDLPVREWKPKADSGLPFMTSLADRIAARLLAAIGLPTNNLTPGDPLFLDGLLSLWHAPGSSGKGTLEPSGQ
jgi:protease-4